ncbi:MAG: hypothetical protein NVSMB64_10740 [Candidatus Velthaea sp.]
MLVNDCAVEVGEANVKVVGLSTNPLDGFACPTAKFVTLPALLVAGTAAVLVVVVAGAVGSPTLLPPPLLQAVKNEKPKDAANQRKQNVFILPSVGQQRNDMDAKR